VYRTARSREVHSNYLLVERYDLLEIEQGFEAAVGDADDLSAAAAHPWQSDFLVFADGSCCGTAAGNSSYIGNFH
jgi:hypothetical protein